MNSSGSSTPFTFHNWISSFEERKKEKKERISVMSPSSPQSMRVTCAIDAGSDDQNQRLVGMVEPKFEGRN